MGRLYSKFYDVIYLIDNSIKIKSHKSELNQKSWTLNNFVKRPLEPVSGIQPDSGFLVVS